MFTLKKIRDYNGTYMYKNQTIKKKLSQLNDEVRTIDLFATPFVINIAHSLAKIVTECSITCTVYMRSLTNSDIKKCVDTPNHFLFILCPHMFLQNKDSYDYPSNLLPIPKDKYFLYQLEKINANIPHFWNPHIKTLILNSKHTFEYTNDNVQYYENNEQYKLKQKMSVMIPPVVDFKQEYFVEWKDKAIDVLLCCSMTRRRQEIINVLVENKINVCIVTNIFGEELTKKISQAKILLNISTEYGSAFEYCRIHEALLSTNTHIISEKPINFDVIIGKTNEYTNRISFIDRIQNNKCEQLLNIISTELTNNKKYTYTGEINKNVKNTLNACCFYPHLFHKHLTGIRNIPTDHNYNIISIRKGIISRHNLCHIHCFNLDKFELMFGSYIQTINKVFDIIITYVETHNNIIEKYNQFTFIKVNNYGMDIGPKFTVHNYLQNNNIKYNYIFYIHSKKSNTRREVYIKPFITNVDYIKNKLNSSNNEPTCYFNNLLMNGDHNSNKWTINKVYIENIQKYLQIKTKNYIFTEGNFYILHKSIIDILFSDRLLYETLNTVNSFDYNWVKTYYKIQNSNISAVYDFYKQHKYFGNNLETNKGHFGLADAMVEHIFERLPITLCKENKVKVDILRCV